MTQPIYLFVDGTERRRKLLGAAALLVVAAFFLPWQVVAFAGAVGLVSIVLRPSVRTLELARGEERDSLPPELP